MISLRIDLAEVVVFSDLIGGKRRIEGMMGLRIREG